MRGEVRAESEVGDGEYDAVAACCVSVDTSSLVVERSVIAQTDAGLSRDQSPIIQLQLGFSGAVILGPSATVEQPLEVEARITRG